MFLKRSLLVTSSAVITLILCGIAFLNDSASFDVAAQPTTAELKSLDGGPLYLKLEQVSPEVVARFLLTCYDGRMYWNAGIVTNNKLSEFKFNEATTNYLEIESDQILPGKRNEGAQVADSTLWIFRPLEDKHLVAIKKAKTIGAWTENGGRFRWGAYMNIENVHDEVVQYLNQCKSAR
jgi:hypothetical protein